MTTGQMLLYAGIACIAAAVVIGIPLCIFFWHRHRSVLREIKNDYR